MKVIMLECQSGDEIREVGKEYSIPDEEAIRLINAQIATPKSKTEYKNVLEKLEAEKDKKEEAERKAAAILHKEELEKEREKLQIRVDEITNSLEDATTYYKKYVDLVSDLEEVAKKEGK